MVLERDGGFPLPTMLGFNEEGMPDGSVPFEDFLGPSGANASQASSVEAAGGKHVEKTEDD